MISLLDDDEWFDTITKVGLPLLDTHHTTSHLTALGDSVGLDGPAVVLFREGRGEDFMHYEAHLAETLVGRQLVTRLVGAGLRGDLEEEASLSLLQLGDVLFKLVSLCNSCTSFSLGAACATSLFSVTPMVELLLLVDVKVLCPFKFHSTRIPSYVKRVQKRNRSALHYGVLGA